jgi:hypothetical protein
MKKNIGSLFSVHLTNQKKKKIRIIKNEFLLNTVFIEHHFYTLENITFKKNWKYFNVEIKKLLGLTMMRIKKIK